VLCRAEFAKKIDAMMFPGIQGGPLMHIIAAKAVALKEALRPEFKKYQQQIVKNANALAEAMAKRGYRLVAGGTDTHLMLVDLSSKGLTGKEAADALDQARVTVNKNLIPFDKQSPFVTSGIRLGTPSVTTRGMKEREMDEIAGFIDEILSNIKSKQKVSQVRRKVSKFIAKFPLYKKRINDMKQ